MSWFFLFLAVLLEVAGTLSMKISQGFTKLTPSLFIFIFYGLSFGSLTLALKTINLSVAYALWAGIGTTLIAVAGIFWFKEPATSLKLLSLVLIILGVIGLNLSEATQTLR
jgi:small multidrug resistance pump